ncbi:hypothetical protein FPN25_02465 [Salmonella enterica]|nr:hypothetical protein [Salmonella enterica]
MSQRFPTESIQAPAVNLNDYSGFTMAGKSMEIIPANAATRIYRIQNLSHEFSIWFNDTGGEAAAGEPGSYELAPGAYYEFSSPFAVSIYAETIFPFSAARY